MAYAILTIEEYNELVKCKQKYEDYKKLCEILCKTNETLREEMESLLHDERRESRYSHIVGASKKLKTNR